MNYENSNNFRIPKMRQQPLFTSPKEYDDITISRHRGAVTSIEANERLKPFKRLQKHQVFAVAKQLPDFTLKEVCREMGKQPNEISGRVTQLLADGLIEIIDGERREGCRVYKVKI